MFMIATIQIKVAGTPTQAGKSWMPRKGNVKRSTCDPGADRHRGRRRHLAPELRPPGQAAEVVDDPDAGRDRGSEQDSPVGAAQLEEGERGDEDPEQERDPAQPRDRPEVQPPAPHPAGRRRRGCARSARPPASERGRRRARAGSPRGLPGCLAASATWATRHSTSCRTAGRLRRRGRERCSRGRSGPRSIEAREDRDVGVLALQALDSLAAPRRGRSGSPSARRAFLIAATAAAAELPVASIGSSTIASRTPRSLGSFT